MDKFVKDGTSLPDGRPEGAEPVHGVHVSVAQALRSSGRIFQDWITTSQESAEWSVCRYKKLTKILISTVIFYCKVNLKFVVEEKAKEKTTFPPVNQRKEVVSVTFNC